MYVKYTVFLLVQVCFICLTLQTSSSESKVFAKEILCPDNQDLQPYCTCNIKSNGINFDCFNITDARQLTKIFQSNTVLQTIHHIYLHDIFIQELIGNVFGENRFEEIFLSCNSNKLQFIHPKAFETSQNSLRFLSINSCNFHNFDLSFLDHFTELEILELQNNQIQQLLNMPELPNLQQLYLLEQDLENLYPFEHTPNLIRFATESSFLTNEDFQGLEHCTGLQKLDIYNADLDGVPPSVLKLEHLEALYISESLNLILNRNSVNFTSKKLQVFAIEHSRMTNIEHGAIIPDNMANTHFVLTDTYLETLDQEVFQELLETMMQGSGFLYLGGTHKFRCGCDMAWVIRDNRHLLSKIVGSTGKECIDGRRFDELDPEEFDDC